MAKIISQTQGTFVHGRQILDGLLVPNECIHFRNKDKLSGLLCKMDFEKDYDRVEWSFLLYLLRRMGFGVKGRSWIRECVSSAYLSIIVYGSRKGFFPAKRGLQQGDPLSPFLFVIVGEALNHMPSVAGEAELISGFK